jgi:hypothetical protein
MLIPGRSVWPTQLEYKYKETADMRLDSRVLSALVKPPPHDAADIRQADVVIGCAIASLVNPKQMLPGAKVTFQSQTLRDLEVCDDFAFDCLVALWTLAD